MNNNKERGKRVSVWRRLAFICGALAVLLVAAIVALYFYVNSPGFVSLLEEKVSEVSGKSVRVGSVSLGPLSGLTVREVTVKDAPGDNHLLSLDAAGVYFSPLGLIRGRVKAVKVTGARVFIDLTEAVGKEGAPVEEAPSQIPFLAPSGPLPAMVEALSLKDLFVTVRSGGGRELEAGPVDLDFTDDGAGSGLLTVSAALPGVPEKVSLSAAIDTSIFSLKDGRVMTGPVVIGGREGEGVFSLPGLSALKGVSGTLDSVIDFETDTEGRSLGIKYEGGFEGIGLRRAGAKGVPGAKTRGEFDGSIKATVSIPLDLSTVELDFALSAAGKGALTGLAPHKLTLKAMYDTGLQKLSVRGLLFDSSVLGRAELKGNIKGLLSGDPAVDVDIGFKNISLTRIGEDILKPFGILAPGFVLEGSADRTVKLKGSVKGGVKVHSALTLTGFRAGEKDKAFDTKGKKLLLDTRLTLFPEEERVALKRLSVKIPKVTSLTVSGAVTEILSGLPTARLDLTLDKTDASSIKPLLPEVLQARIDSLSLSGSVSSTASVKVKPGPGGVLGVTVSSAGAIKGGAFSTGDGYAGGEGVEIEYKASLITSLPLKEAGFDVTASASNFVLLIGNFFADLTGKAVSADTMGTFSFESGELLVEKGEVNLAGTTSIGFSGGVKSLYKDPHFDAGITLNLSSIGEAYDLYIKDNAAAISPVLSGVRLDGSAKARLRAIGGARAVKASGELTLDLLSLEDEERGLFIEDLALTLPVDLGWPETEGKKGERSEPPVYGELSLVGGKWNDILFEEFRMRPVIWQNDFSLADDVAIPVFGGRVELMGLRMTSLLSPWRELGVTVGIDALALEEFSLSLGLPPLKGTLTGTIPEVQLRGSTLTTEGEILLKVFNGSIRISGISVEDIFSPAASIKSDIELKELDLGELTGAFEYGGITGILEGYVKGLVITDGQPESFEANIGTVRRRGVRQKISVQALKNISVIGSGGAGAVFSTGIYRFFDSYGYSKLGFNGSLRNDNFILRGVDNDGEKGYLVRGGLIPPRVDVVTYSRNVSFKEMVERLKRIETAK